jgi:hypothetical protein
MVTPGSGEGVSEKDPRAPRRHPYLTSFRLLLTFLHEQTGTPPSKLQLEDLDPARISAFLSHLERARQQRPDPQRQADSDPLVLSLRGVESPGVLRADREGPLDPREALPATDSPVATRRRTAHRSLRALSTRAERCLVSLRLRALRLLGAGRNYGVDFTVDGAASPLSVIAGEISTGKTSVLEFIDYCLGSSRHPRHLEIQRRVRSTLLEVDIDGEIAVIERPTFSTEQFATVHRCGLDQIAEAHTTERRPLAPPGDPNSLSSFLLAATGLHGIQVKEAPTQPRSGVDPLSFRDLMPLSFLTNQRMDNKNLLLESQFMRNLKLVQVIEILFGVYDDQLAAMSDQLDRLEHERTDLAAEITSLETFLAENGVSGRLELDARSAALKQRLEDARTRLDALNARMQAETAYAADARAEYGRLRRRSGESAARVRDRETLLRRLLPLRGQYAEDERKLVFFREAERLFDPLRVRICPACMQELPSPVEIEAGGTCSLCHQHIPVAPEPVDIAAERTAVRARLRSIDRYIEEVEKQFAEASAAYQHDIRDETAAQRRLDSQVGKDLSPFLAERDELMRARAAIESDEREVAQQVRWRDGLDRRHADAGRLDQQIIELRERIAGIRSRRPDRAAVLLDLTERFAELLAAFAFPKLDEPEPPYLNDKFVPYVRGNRYTDIGSTGALTLISLAWELAIFERSIEQGNPHPGFLMIDSPQKNLKPETGGAAGDEFVDGAIPRRVWEHIVGWTAGTGSSAQIIVVDNLPPDIADDHVVVRFSGQANDPPYGLIEDETG